MKKRILTVLLSVCIVLALLPATALADSENGTVTTADALKSAVAAGGTVTLGADISLTEALEIPESATVTLNLGGYTLTQTGTKIRDDDVDGVNAINNSGNLTISGAGSIVGTWNGIYNTGTGVLTVDGATVSGYWDSIYNEGTVTIEDGTFTSLYEPIGLYQGEGAENEISLTIHGGTFNSTLDAEESEDGWYAIFADPEIAVSTSIIITGGTFNDPLSLSLGDVEDCTLTICGGTFYDNSIYGAVCVDNFDVTISGGTFNATGEQAAFKFCTVAGNDCTVSSGTFSAESGCAINISGDAGKCSISGGQFTGSVTVSVSSQADADDNKIITGGTFSKDVSTYVADGNKAISNDDGTYSIGIDTEKAVAEVNGVGYTTIQAAIDAAGTTTATVTLLANTNEDITIAAGQNITLNLNGKTLTNSSGDTITVALNGELTVTGDGTVDNKTHAKAAVFNNGTVILNGGIYDRTSETGESASVSGGNSWYTICNHGTMTINDGVTVRNTGSFSSMIENGYYSYSGTDSRISYVENTNQASPTLTINDGTFIGGLNTVKNDDGGVLIINDGDFSNTTQASILNWNDATINGGTFTVTAANCSAVLNGANPATSSDYDQGKLTINGGSFTATGSAITNNFTGSTKPVVANGSFSSSVSEYVIDKLNYELNSKGTYTYYETKDKALAAAQPGDKIADLSQSDENGTSATPVEVVAVTFDANGGTCATESKLVLKGDKIGTLPTPTRGGYYYFLGWYVGSEKVDSSYVVKSDVELTAEWAYIPPVNPGYSVTAPAADNGTVTVTPSSAVKGATVKITVTPDKDYELSGLTVTDSNGNRVPLTQVSENKFTFTMPASKVTVSAEFSEIQPEPWVNPYADVTATAWYYDAVQYVTEHGLMGGYNGLFAPTDTTSRSMIVTILYRLEGEPAVSGTTEFSDVAAGSWYTDAVAWAAANGIMGGYGNGVFGINDAITRQDLATTLLRYAKYKGYDISAQADLSGYTDASAIASYALEAMRWANAEGLINGANAVIGPNGNAERAMAAAILMRFCENVAK